MSTFADLRIASKRARYDNNKPYGTSETIILYIYNAGPDKAVAPVVKAGYTRSMDYENVTTTLRQATEWHTPSQDIQNGSLTWTNLDNPTSHYEGWDMVTTLPDIPAGILMELSLSFPMTHETSYDDDTISASVSSSVADPRSKNNSTTYIITPNHHDDGADYWNTPGNLANLDFNGLTSVEPIFRADLRIASARARYNNNLPYGKSETLSFFVFNDGPTIATKPLVRAGYTTSMDYDNVSCSGEEVWIPDDGVKLSLLLSKEEVSTLQWKPLDGVRCHYEGWDIICSVPDIPPATLYRINITFPMTHDTTYKDWNATASVSSQATEVDPSNNFTTYWITPNHDDDGDEYWQTPGNIAQLDGPSEPSGSRVCQTGWLIDTPVIVATSDGREEVPLKDLEIDISKRQILSYDIGRKSLQPKSATRVEYGTSSKVVYLSFSADHKTEQTFGAHPDTLVYLEPTMVTVGKDQLRLGYWMPVQALWVGATIRGMDPDGGLTTAYVTNVWQEAQQGSQSGEPVMVSTSHSYVVGTVRQGGVLTHNPKDAPLCGQANVLAILAALMIVGDRLVATTTPRPDMPNPPHGYSLRNRRPRDPPPPPRPAPPVLPMDVPRRDEHGNWLIYLYEEDTPGAVENARHGIESGHPWRLTYNPADEPNRRRQQSTGQYQSQSELLNLTSEELTGTTGTAGQLDRDEYPPAIALEGGTGALVTYIESGDNRRAGSLMGRQFTNYRMDPQPDGHAPLAAGDTFRYAIIHGELAGLEYLGDDLTDEESQIERPPID